MSNRWKVVAAKAKFSSVIKQSRREVQIIENRGRPTAVVMSIADYSAAVEPSTDRARWRKFLETSERLRAEGGESLAIPSRQARLSPFANEKTGNRRRKRARQ